MRRAALILFASLALAAPAEAQNVVVDFNDAPAGESVNTRYQATPGVIFGAGVENPPGGDFPSYSTCGTRVDAVASAWSPPNVATLVCGGSNEFPDPPVLFGKFTTTTRSAVTVRVGDTGGGGHTARLSVYDGEGTLLQRSVAQNVLPTGRTLSVTVGQPEITYFVIEETGTDTSAGMWIDNLEFDTPPVPGKKSFSIATTSGQKSVRVRQGSTADVDITVFRTNGSAGDVDMDVVSGLPSNMRATFSPSTNGQRLRLRAAFDASTPVPPPVIEVVATPVDANTGTVPQRLTLEVIADDAIKLTTDGSIERPLPGCQPIRLFYDIAPEVGSPAFSITGLPSGVRATWDGADGPPAVGGTGSVVLDLIQSGDVAPFTATVALTSVTLTDPVTGRPANFRSGIDFRMRAAQPMSSVEADAPLRTAQQLAPGTIVTVRGGETCVTSSSMVQFGNAQALAPLLAGSEAGRLRVEVPPLATSGEVRFVPAPGAGSVGGPTAVVDNYRNTVGAAFDNYSPNITLEDLTAAFGRDQTFFTPNLCSGLTFGVLDCKVSTPVPDPWALVLTQILSATVGSDSGGACFGFSTISQRLRRGTLKLSDFGVPAARNTFQLGDNNKLKDAIEGAQVSQFSEEYLAYYARQVVGNVLSRDPGDLRVEIEDHLRKGDHPKISLRNGGTTLDGLHVVVGYNVETDPNQFGAYYIDVYDNNLSFVDPPRPFPVAGGGTMPFGEHDLNGVLHKQYQEGSRIHVRSDGSWSMPSSGYGGRTLENIVVSASDFPGTKPTMISAAGGLKNGLTIMFGWTASALVNLRQDGGAAVEPPPTTVTQITSGDRKLYSAPGVINTDPATALRAAPWAPATGSPDSPSDGHLLAQGPGASYTVEATGVRADEQTRTLVGSDMIAQVTTPAKPGVTDTFTVVPRDDSVGFAPGEGAAPLEVQMMVRTSDDATRTAEVETTTSAGGADSVGFDSGQSEIVIEHEGPPATVDLTLSSTNANSLPEAITAKIKVGRNAKATVRPKSWKRLGKGRLTVRSKGRVRRVKTRRQRVKGAKLTKLAIAKGIATASVTVPATIDAGAATISYVLRRGRRVVDTFAAPAGGPGTRTVAWKLPSKAKRGDRLVAVATTVVARGSSFNTAVSRRKARVRK